MFGPQHRNCGCMSMDSFYISRQIAYAGQDDCHIVPLVIRSVTVSSMSASVSRLTQKPALDIHLDNNLKVTARVGRISNGTDAPMTSPLRLCSSSPGDRVAGSSDIFRT